MADVSKLFGITDQEIEAVKGEGIETVEAFYEVAKHPDSRTELAGKTGIESFRLEGALFYRGKLHSHDGLLLG